jgi:homoaconitase/3-isopropylmalate dehydratase large subunit
MPGVVKKPKTLYDKVFEDHIVNEQEDGTILLYIGTAKKIRERMGSFLLTLHNSQTDIWSTRSHRR